MKTTLLATLATLGLIAGAAASPAVATAAVKATGIEDVTRDGVPDLAVVVGEGESGKVHLFSGADGSFVRSRKASGRSARALLERALDGQGRVAEDDVVGDLDGDDVAEIVAGDWDEGELRVFSGAELRPLFSLRSPDAPRDDLAAAAWFGSPCRRREAYVKSGGWRTLDWVWNAEAQAYFTRPRGAYVKIRYGLGWFGWDSQKKKLDGFTERELEVSGGASKVGARIQIKVPSSQSISYTFCGR